MAAIAAKVEPACSRCAAEPRLPRQRWGRRCLTAAQRARRSARRALRAGPPLAPDREAPAPGAGGPISPPETPGAAGALASYHAAAAELARVARDTDWRRSRYSPSIVLRPLQRAVTQAEAECRRLGVPVDVLKHPASRA